MKILYRTAMTVVLAGLLALCLFGFFAASSNYQSSRKMPWRLICLAGMIGCVTGTYVLWSGPSDESD